MSGIINEAGSKSFIISGVQSSAPSHAIVPIAATTLGGSLTAVELTDQASSTILPKTADITVNDSDRTIAVTHGGLYFYHFVAMITEADGSRENYVAGYVANNAVPDGTSTNIFHAYFTNSATPAGVNYFNVTNSGIVTLSALDRIKMFGLGQYSSQVLSVSATVNRSSFTLIRMK